MTEGFFPNLLRALKYSTSHGNSTSVYITPLVAVPSLLTNTFDSYFCSRMMRSCTFLHATLGSMLYFGYSAVQFFCYWWECAKKKHGTMQKTMSKSGIRENNVRTTYAFPYNRLSPIPIAPLFEAINLRTICLPVVSFRHGVSNGRWRYCSLKPDNNSFQSLNIFARGLYFGHFA